MEKTNITDTITNHLPGLQTAANQVEQVLHLPVPILLMFVLNGLAIIVRKSSLKNWWISLMVVGAATFVYPQLTSPANTVFKSVTNWNLYLQGCMLGLGSLGVDLFLEKFAWYRAFTKSISDDKIVEKLNRQVETAKQDANATGVFNKCDFVDKDKKP